MHWHLLHTWSKRREVWRKWSALDLILIKGYQLSVWNLLVWKSPLLSACGTFLSRERTTWWIPSGWKSWHRTRFLRILVFSLTMRQSALFEACRYSGSDRTFQFKHGVDRLFWRKQKSGHSKHPRTLHRARLASLRKGQLCVGVGWCRVKFICGRPTIQLDSF